ncbi:hypothetical protein [Aliivibrio fischeri]|uniref:Uncharacterized protein n=1 Tax=Aliivibrio fischeri TaxID=668 RepID=A0A844P697_ALIFS|nr:hypothetical protein [Aliivibrio fischeri]MUK51542.1 hypothetical protein [Aliivibrio fischeri]
MDNISTILISSISTASVLGLIAFIFRSWIIERLKASIKYEYDLKKLDIENQKEIRTKSEVVADLLAEWVRQCEHLDYHQLNKLSFQAYLWLPKELAEDLSDSLAHQKGSKDVRTLLKDIRTHLHGKDDGLASNCVIVFDEPECHLNHMPLYRNEGSSKRNIIRG